MPRRCTSLIVLGVLFLALSGKASADQDPSTLGSKLVAEQASADQNPSTLGSKLVAQADRQTPPEDATGPTGAPADVAGGAPIVPAAQLVEDAGPTRPRDLSYGVAARLRWVSVPGWLLNAFTKKNVPLSSWGTGIELLRRKANFDVVLSFGYQNMSPSDGNWLGSGNNAATDTNFVQFQKFALYSVDAAFIWHTTFTDWFGAHYGAGFGLGIVGGRILRTIDNSGDCTDANAGNLSQCHPVTCTATSCTDAQLQAGGRFVSSDVPPAVPIINVVLGLDFRLPRVRGWEAKIEGGFFDAFYLGGGVGYTF
jgi:hypothetical protein